MKKTRDLSLTFALLVLLIASTPVLAIGPGWLGPQLLSLIVAIMLLLLPGAPAADVQRSLAIFRPLAATAALPALWIVVQMIPVPPGTIDHPIWRSAAAALSESLFGHVSIDLGFTLRALFGYLSLVALTFGTIVLTRERERAETLLFGLCAITTFVAVELILFENVPTLSPARPPSDFKAVLSALAAFGAILNAALTVRTIERLQTRTSDQPHALRNHIGMMLAGIGGAIVCLVALTRSTTYDVLIAAAFGVTVLGLVILIRRLSLRRWTAATICAAVFIACMGMVALRVAASPSASPLFWFARFNSSDATAAALRMMADANWVGAGVGNYSALAAIYRDATGAPGPTAITTLMSVILVWGRIGLLVLILLMLQLTVILFRGALSRGRDSFYAAGAAGCLVTGLCQAYCDASFTEVVVQMMAAIVIGLGLSQSVGRRS